MPETSLLIVIPSRGGDVDIDKVLRCIESNIHYLGLMKYRVTYQVVVSINGIEDAELLDNHIPNASQHPNCTVLSIRNPGKVNAIIHACWDRQADYLITLDDDVYFEANTFYIALSVLSENPLIELVGFQSKILPYWGGNIFRKFIYDVINIKLLLSLYKGIDPFLFGRFIAMRGCNYPVPGNYLVDDIYLSLYYRGRYIIRPEPIFTYGQASIRKHIKRVILLENARRQVKNNFSMEWNINQQSCKREIDWSKLKTASSYYKFCYLCYSLLRLITNHIIAKIFRNQSLKW